MLTSQSDPITLSDSCDCGKIADLIAEFCKSQDLSEPRDGWDKEIKDYPNLTEWFDKLKVDLDKNLTESFSGEAKLIEETVGELNERKD